MIDTLIWIVVALIAGYKWAEHRNKDVAERLREARSNGYVEGITAAINAMRDVTTANILDKLNIKIK